MAFNSIELQIINTASILLNDTVVTSLDLNSAFVLKATNAFKFLFEPTIAGSDWRFATVIKEADELVDQKPEFADFRFKMRLPADLLAIQSVFNTGGSSNSLIDYVPFADNIIFTNVNKVSVEYRRKVDINVVPSYFIHYMGFAVADFLALGYTKVQKKEQIEKQRIKAKAFALYVDRQNYPMTAIKSNPAAHHSFSGRLSCDPFIGGFNG